MRINKKLLKLFLNNSKFTKFKNKVILSTRIMLIKQERYVQSCIAHLLATKWAPLARLKYSHSLNAEGIGKGGMEKRDAKKGFIFGKSAKKFILTISKKIFIFMFVR